MRFVCCSLLVCLVASPSRAQAKQKVLAVFDVEDRGTGLKGSTLRNINAYMADRLAAAAGLRVMSSERLRAAVAARRKRTRKGCLEPACQVQVGKALGAQLTLATRMMKIGSRCTVTGTVHDLRRRPAGRTLGVAKGACSADAVLTSADHVVKALLGRLPRSSAPAAPTSTGHKRLYASLAVVALHKGKPIPASVFLDGKRVARTPALLSNLSPGTHLLKIQARGYKSITRTMTIGPGQQSRLVVGLTR